MIPKLRFPEFVDEWKLVRLNEVASLINGLTYSPSMVCDEGILVLRSSNVQNGILTYSDNVFVADTDYKAVKEGDILMCVRNGSRSLIGKTAVIDKDAAGLAFGAFMVAIRSKSVVNQSFLSQIFQTKIFFRDVHRNLGATINSINNSSLNRFQFGIPSNTTETKKLGSFFELLSYKINLLTKKKEALETYKKGLMQKIFSQELRFKREDGTYYDDWEHALLDNLCTIKTGKLDANAQIIDGEYPFYTCSREVYRTNTYSFSGEALTIAGNGDVGIMHLADGKFNAYQRTYVLQKFSVNRLYLKYFLEKHLPIRVKRELNIGAMPYIVLGTLKNMSISIPSNVELLKITNVLFALERNIDTVSKQVNKMTELKKGLLQEMFV